MTAARSLHVITSDARRGAETFAIDLVTALARSAVPAEVVALRASGAPTAYDVPALGSSRRSVAALTRLRRLASKADVVVAHGSATLEACGVALAGSSTPFVYRNIGDPDYWVRPGVRRHGVGVLMRRASRVAALWPDAALTIHQRYGIPAGCIDVLPNAVDERRFPPADDRTRADARTRLGLGDSPCFGYVGALSPEKDVATAIRATAAVAGAVLLVAGDGPLEPSLRRLAHEVAPGRVRFLGQVTDPRPLYEAMDLLLLPSLSEGMPAVVFEAGLVGVPSVASAVGSLPSTVDDGETGFLVAPGKPDLFAATVAAALPRSAVVGRRAATAYRDAYSIDAIAPAWQATIERAASAGSDR